MRASRPPAGRAAPARAAGFRLAAALAAGALLALATACATNPATGRREFSLVTPAQESAIGAAGYPAAVAEYGVYDDPAVAAYVDSVGQRLARVSELPNIAWKFTVLDDPVVNAFAMPGGYIFITRGILAHLESEAQLAGVLGHEIGHVTARHSAKQITQQQLAGLGLGLAGAFSDAFRRYGAVANQALGLLMLKYSRDDESQADALGVRYATAAGYDPREMPATYAMLKRVGESGGQSLPAFLSTHPDPGDREQRTTALAAQAAAGKTGLSVRQRGYLEHLRGLVYGDDPRQGYVEDGRYVAPQLGLELAFPSGWKVQCSHAAAQGQDPQGQAALQASLAANAGAASPGEFVAALTRDGRIAASEGGGETPGGWPAWVGRIVVPAQGGGAATLVAAFVRVAPGQLLQLLGQSAAPGDANERAIFSAIRSLRPLEPARAHPEPMRVKLVASGREGAFSAVLPGLGGTAVGVTEASIMNGLAADDEVVHTGQLLKLVEPGRRK